MSQQENDSNRGRPATVDEIASVLRLREIKDKSIENINQSLLWLVACAWSLFNVCTFIYDKIDCHYLIISSMFCLFVSVGCAFGGLLPLCWYRLHSSPVEIEEFLFDVLYRKWFAMVVLSILLLAAGLLLSLALFLVS